MVAVNNVCGSPFLSGNFAPVEDEMESPRLEVTGAIPSALSGLYLRNGPNPMFEPLGKYHWFDGDGMLHGVRITNGRASYRNRWVRSRGLAVEQRNGRAVYGGMSTIAQLDPAVVREGGAMKNTANTNVVRHAGRILCLMEGGLPTEVTPDLETVGEYDFGGKLASAFTAHPHVDGRTGEMLAFSYVPSLQLLRVSAAGELIQVEQIAVPKPTMMHDFTITERHAVFFDAPAVMDFAAFLQGDQLVRWCPENGTRIGVLPRGSSGSDVRWIEIENGYVVHFLNSWDEGDEVVVLGCRFDRMDFGAGEGDAPAADAYLTRFRVNPAAGTVKQERIGELPSEFPRVRPEFEGYRNRFGVAASFARSAPNGPAFDSVTLYDLERGTERTHTFREGEVTGEPVFAPDPSGSAENDGWVLAMVSDRDGRHSDLVILDAHDLSETARVHMPRRVPFGFHGNWLPDGSESMTTPRAR